MSDSLGNHTNPNVGMIFHKSEILFPLAKLPMNRGCLTSRILFWHRELYSLALNVGVAARIPTCASGLVNDNDGSAGIAYISDPPPIIRGAAPKTVCI